MKHPRAANFAWRCRNGLLPVLYHNHGGTGYEDRNPAWLACGRESGQRPRQGFGLVAAGNRPYDDDPAIG
jgi:hypothetical protein